MSVQVASIIFVAIMGIGLGVWLFSLLCAINMGRLKGSASDGFGEGIQPKKTDCVVGEVTVEGNQEEVGKRIVRAFRDTKFAAFGTRFQLLERSPERIVVEKVAPLICNQPIGLYFSDVEFRLSQEREDEVRVAYQIGFEKLTQLFKRISFGLILGVGMPVVLILGCIIWFLVVQNESPIIRWQVLQTIHICHVLWPPFMFLWMSSAGRKNAQGFVEDLVLTTE